MLYFLISSGSLASRSTTQTCPTWAAAPDRSCWVALGASRLSGTCLRRSKTILPASRWCGWPEGGAPRCRGFLLWSGLDKEEEEEEELLVCVLQLFTQTLTRTELRLAASMTEEATRGRASSFFLFFFLDVFSRTPLFLIFFFFRFAVRKHSCVDVRETGAGLVPLLDWLLFLVFLFLLKWPIKNQRSLWEEKAPRTLTCGRESLSFYRFDSLTFL